MNTSDKREDILERARAIAIASTTNTERSQSGTDANSSSEFRALGRRRARDWLPLEERSERRDAPYRPRGDRAPTGTTERTGAVERVNDARGTATRGTAARGTAEDAERQAKANSVMLGMLPDGERPMVEQAFSIRAPSKVPRAARQRFLDALAAKKLRDAAGVGPRAAVSEEWLRAHPKERARAIGEAVTEEGKIHAKATSKVTYKNMAAQLMLRGGESVKPAPGALKQEYKCDAADGVDLSVARTVRGDAFTFFIDACRHRSGNAHPRWFDESVEDVDDAKTIESDDIEQPSPEVMVSPEVAVCALCRTYIKSLVESGAYDDSLSEIVKEKVVKKVMARRRDATDASFVDKESASIQKLIASQFEAETKRAARR